MLSDWSLWQNRSIQVLNIHIKVVRKLGNENCNTYRYIQLICRQIWPCFDNFEFYERPEQLVSFCRQMQAIAQEMRDFTTSRRRFAHRFLPHPSPELHHWDVHVDAQLSHGISIQRSHVRPAIWDSSIFLAMLGPDGGTNSGGRNEQ